MKLRTRKLLAGLLSFGMLLQAASPLSALAAGDASAAAQAAPVSSLIIRDGASDNYATVKYTLNHYADGSVSWENDKKPFDGIDVKYDTATSTFVFTGTLSLPESEEPFVNLTCTDPKTDSIKLDGNGDNAVGAALTVGFPAQTRGAKDITIVTNSSSSAAIKGYATIDCYGDVTIENPSGKATGGATRTAEGVLVYGNAQNVTVTGDDSSFIISGDFSVYSKGDVTLMNPSGAITESYIRVAESTGDVKIEGNSIKGLALYNGTSINSTRVQAKSLTMQNDGGSIGNLTFTRADTTSDYYIVTGDSASSASQTKMEGAVYGPEVVSAKYLCISTNEFVPAPATPYGFSVNGTAVTAENAETVLPDGMTYDKAANKLTASKDITGALTIAADGTNTTLDVELKSVDGALAVGKYSEPGARNVTINGTVTGNTNVNCTGDIVVNGTIASEQNGADGQNRLDTTTGEITVTSDGAVWGQYAMVILKALNGPVKVSGNKPNEDLVGNSLTIWATETEISNPDGKINAIQFVPQNDGDYYINKDTEPAEQRDFAVNGEKVIYSKAVDSKLTISQTKYVAPAALAITLTRNGVPETAYVYEDTTSVVLGGETIAVKSDGAGGYVINSSIGRWQGDAHNGDYSDVITISGANGETPNVTLNGSINGSLVVKDLNDFTMYGGCYRKVDVAINGDLMIEANTNAAQTGMTVDAGGSVTIIGTSIAITVSGGVYDDIKIKCGGDLWLENKAGGSVIGGDLTAESGGTVTIKADHAYPIMPSYRDTKITAKKLLVVNENANGTVGKLTYTTPDGKTYTGTVDSSTLECDEDHMPAHQHTAEKEWKFDKNGHWKLCTVCGVKVEEGEHSFNDKGVCKCGYEKPGQIDPPSHQHTAGTEWESDKDYHWHTCTTCEEDVQLDKAPHNFGEDGKAEKCEDCEFANPDYVAPTPPDPVIPDPDDTTGDGSGAGGVIAGVAIGGAALFVGYEVVSDIILGNILPDGADTPVNRGQLAWLIWGAKGAPMPENQPAFTDVSDPEMALAAQWCVEQGILDAKSETTFRPNGWTPKFSVIKTWNKAFPTA